jgi:hypothetical protein
MRVKRPGGRTIQSAACSMANPTVILWPGRLPAPLPKTGGCAAWYGSRRVDPSVRSRFAMCSARQGASNDSHQTSGVGAHGCIRV